MQPVKIMRPRVSYTDLQHAPEDGRRYELYDGEVFVVPAPFLRHQLVAQDLFKLLDSYAETHGGQAVISPFDIVLSEYDVVQPDVVFFACSRKRHLHLDEPTRVKPDIAVEVLSPSTAATDRGKKMQMLARYQVSEYWLVDPTACTVEVYFLAGDSYRLVQTAREQDELRSATLAEMALPAARIFAGLK